VVSGGLVSYEHGLTSPGHWLLQLLGAAHRPRSVPSHHKSEEGPHGLGHEPWCSSQLTHVTRLIPTSHSSIS